MADNALPTVREELNRKTFETIEWLFDRLRAGQLSQQQFSTGIDAVWGTANGLVDEQILEIVSVADAVAGRDPGCRRRVFHKGGKTAVVTWIVGDEHIEADVVGPAGVHRKTMRTDTAIEACQALDKFAEKLLAGGWEEL